MEAARRRHKQVALPSPKLAQKKRQESATRSGSCLVTSNVSNPKYIQMYKPFPYGTVFRRSYTVTLWTCSPLHRSDSVRVHSSSVYISYHALVNRLESVQFSAPLRLQGNILIRTKYVGVRSRPTCMYYRYVSGYHRKDLPHKYHQFVEVTRSWSLVRLCDITHLL